MNDPIPDLNAFITDDWSTSSLMRHSFSKPSEWQFVLYIGHKYITREAVAIISGLLWDSSTEKWITNSQNWEAKGA